jgi:hypothetical protein
MAGSLVAFIVLFDHQRAFRVIHIDYSQIQLLLMTLPKKIQGRDEQLPPQEFPTVGWIMSACSTPRGTAASRLATTLHLAGQPRPLHHHHQGQDRNLWRAINSSNKTNGLVVATPVYLPLRRSSLAGPVPPSIFSCFSAFLFFICLRPQF